MADQAYYLVHIVDESSASLIWKRGTPTRGAALPSTSQAYHVETDNGMITGYDLRLPTSHAAFASMRARGAVSGGQRISWSALLPSSAIDGGSERYAAELTIEAIQQSIARKRQSPGWWCRRLQHNVPINQSEDPDRVNVVTKNESVPAQIRAGRVGRRSVREHNSSFEMFAKAGTRIFVFEPLDAQ